MLGIDLAIEHCTGLRNIKLLNLRNIRSLTICIHQLVKIQAPALEHLSYSNYCLKLLNICDYENLKSLKISFTEVSYRYLNDLISIPYCLERLILSEALS